MKFRDQLMASTCCRLLCSLDAVRLRTAELRPPLAPLRPAACAAACGQSGWQLQSCSGLWACEGGQWGTARAMLPPNLSASRRAQCVPAMLREGLGCSKSTEVLAQHSTTYLHTFGINTQSSHKVWCVPSQVVVIDNGGGTCKLGLASQPASVRRAAPCPNRIRC